VLRELIETVLLAVAIFVGVNIISARFRIDGDSMADSFHNGQYIIVNRMAYRFNPPTRGDVVVFIPPESSPATFWENLLGRPGQTDFIKRIVAVPGDTVEIDAGHLYVNGAQVLEPYLREPMRAAGKHHWQLAAEQYLVLGDNRNFSKDSRAAHIGPVPMGQIVGRVWAVYFPIQDWRIVSSPQSQD
jgi:signal peptidase I